MREELKIGDWVYFRNDKDVPIDTTQGIIVDQREDGLYLVNWADGYRNYYTDTGLVKV